MSNEYKWLLKKVARDFISDTLLQDSETGEYTNLDEVEAEYEKIKEELDRVYAQAAKVDEYEAKAAAIDEIKVYMQSAEDKLCDEEYFNEDVYEEYYGIIESVIEHHSECESGESG